MDEKSRIEWELLPEKSSKHRRDAKLGQKSKLNIRSMLDKENEASFSRLLGLSTHDSLVDMSLESPLQELVPLNLKHLITKRQNCTWQTLDSSS